MVSKPGLPSVWSIPTACQGESETVCVQNRTKMPSLYPPPINYSPSWQNSSAVVGDIQRGCKIVGWGDLNAFPSVFLPVFPSSHNLPSFLPKPHHSLIFLTKICRRLAAIFLLCSLSQTGFYPLVFPFLYTDTRSGILPPLILSLPSVGHYSRTINKSCVVLCLLPLLRRLVSLSRRARGPSKQGRQKDPTLVAEVRGLAEAAIYSGYSGYQRQRPSTTSTAAWDYSSLVSDHSDLLVAD